MLRLTATLHTYPYAYGQGTLTQSSCAGPGCPVGAGRRACEGRPKLHLPVVAPVTPAGGPLKCQKKSFSSVFYPSSLPPQAARDMRIRGHDLGPPSQRPRGGLHSHPAHGSRGSSSAASNLMIIPLNVAILVRRATASSADRRPPRGLGAGGCADTAPRCPQVVGTRGDVQPFTGIGLKLAAAGHRVRLATHACFRWVGWPGRVALHTLGAGAQAG